MLSMLSDDDLLAKCLHNTDPLVQELCKRLEQANECNDLHVDARAEDLSHIATLEQELNALRVSAGCVSNSDLLEFVRRNADDGK